VLCAQGLSDLQDIRRVVESVSLPVNVLALANVPPVHELASVGVRRISLGGAFAFAALGAVVSAANELREQGTYGYWQDAMLGARAVRSVFG
jgi:2-methylisocitrate lyase-like PEP mutase family enzyme